MYGIFLVVDISTVAVGDERAKRIGERACFGKQIAARIVGVGDGVVIDYPSVFGIRRIHLP